MNTKSLFIFYVAYTCCSYLMGQGTIEFETQIYVKDAQGNKDSIIVSFASSLTEFYNPEFGELADTSALDSVLDIRGVVLDHNNFGEFVCFTKKLITNAHSPYDFNGTTCYTTIETMHLAIYAKYQPVTIYWNKDDWDHECIKASWISTSAQWLTAIGWWNLLLDSSEYQCLLESDSVNWKLPARPISCPDCWIQEKMYRVHPVEGGGMDTIPFVQIAPKYRLFFDTPCRYSGTDDETPAFHSLSIYPNPADELLSFPDAESSAEVRIYDVVGRLRLLRYGSEADVSGLPPGLYTVTLEQSGRLKTGRFVKR